MNMFLAIDGGGTKTDAVLLREDGVVLKRVTGKGCNPNDIGFDNACNIISVVTSELLSNLNGCNTCLCGVFAGLSGGTISNYKERFSVFLKELFPNAKFVCNHSDAISALSSGVAHQDGCVIISGTGSIAYARSGEQLFRVGGCGYLLDKGGSGYDFGRDVLYYALCSSDGRSKATLLQQLVEEKLRMPVGEAVGEIYAKGKPFIASFAPLAFEALRQGDSIATKIFESNMEEMAKLLNTVSTYLPKTAFPCKTVLTGGIFEDFADMKPFLLPKLENQHIFFRPTLPPVYGSALEAIAVAKITPCLEFEKNFNQTYKQNEKRL